MHPIYDQKPAKAPILVYTLFTIYIPYLLCMKSLAKTWYKYSSTYNHSATPLLIPFKANLI